jgi:hypothetical protein
MSAGYGSVATAPDSPPRRTWRTKIVDAVQRRPQLAITPLLVIAVLSVVVTVLRAPTFTATAELQVGRFRPPPEPVDIEEDPRIGFALLAELVAGTYRQATGSEEVVRAAAERLRVTPAEIRRRVSARVLSKSLAIEVEAKAPSREGAVASANTVSALTVAFTDSLGRPDANRQELLKRYRRLSLDIRRVLARLTSRRRRDVRATDTLLNELAVAQLRRDALSSNLGQAAEPKRAAESIRVLRYAADAESDRRGFLIRLLYVGEIAAVLLGLVLAVVAEYWGAARPSSAT